MFAAENLRDWLGQTVIGPQGHKIGMLEAAYVDTTSDEPCFITVKVGMMSRHRLVFVPVAGATSWRSTTCLTVRYCKFDARQVRRRDERTKLAAIDRVACQDSGLLAWGFHGGDVPGREHGSKLVVNLVSRSRIHLHRLRAT